jgi:hypothetical protein
MKKKQGNESYAKYVVAAVLLAVFAISMYGYMAPAPVKEPIVVQEKLECRSWERISTYDMNCTTKIRYPNIPELNQSVAMAYCKIKCEIMGSSLIAYEAFNMTGISYDRMIEWKKFCKDGNGTYSIIEYYDDVCTDYHVVSYV